MTTRRITIGMKPDASDTEPTEPAFSIAERAPFTAGPATATIEDYAAHREPRPEQVSPDMWVQQGGETAKPAATTSFGRMSPLVGMAAGAAIGAIVAAVSMIVLSPKLVPSMDVRLGPVADRVAAIELRQQQGELVVGRLNNEIAQAIEADNASATGLEKQIAEFAEMQALLASHIAAAPAAEDDTSLAVFAVAVGQLRAAFYSGRPFEAEIVTLRSLAEGDGNVLGLLNELAAPARPGVANAAMLRQQFAADAAAAGLKLGASQSYYDYGMSMVGEYIGYNSEPYAVEVANVMVNDADRRLAGGDVAGAVEVINGLDRETVAAFQPWLKSAGAYVRTDAAVAAMTDTVIDRLKESMGNEDSG
jgi:hypothetical protein